MADNLLTQGQIVGGRWRIDRFIASGGFGGVYAATDTSSASIGSVAVKVLLEGASTAERQGFLDEMRHMGSLRHENLVGYIDSGLLADHEQGAVFLVLELCQESLADHCGRQSRGVLPQARLPELVEQISAGLDYLHRSGRVHRDLKPANILRAGDLWKLADFGLVRQLSESGVYHLQTLVGTPRYMAPEFFTDGPIGPATDLWSVGVLLHEILTGDAPVKGEGAAYVHALTNTPPNISAELAPEAAELIRRCLAADPSQRPTAAELPAVLAGEAVTPSPAAAGTAAAAATMIATPTPEGDAAGDTASDGGVRFTPPGARAAGPPLGSSSGRPSAATTAAPLAAAGGTAAAGAGTADRATDPLSAPTVTAVAPTADVAGAQGPDAGGDPDGPGGRRRWLLIGLLAALIVVAAAAGVVGLGLFDGDENDVAAGGDESADTSGSATDGDGADDAGAPGLEDVEVDPVDEMAAAEAAAEAALGGADNGEEAGADDGADNDGAVDPEVDGGEFGDPSTPAVFEDLQSGECVDGIISDAGLLIPTGPLPCDGPHLFEIIGIIEAPEAGGPFPGQDTLTASNAVTCSEIFADRFGIDQAITRLSILAMTPSEEQWNDGIYQQVCVVNRGDIQPLLAPLSDDLDEFLWKSGDSLSVIEIQDGFCFDTPVGLDEGFTQRVVYRDCTEPHDGEGYGNALIPDVDTDDDGLYVYPGEGALAQRAFRPCHDRLHDRYGADHGDAGIAGRALVQSAAEFNGTSIPLAVCVVLFDEPVDVPAIELATL